MRRGRAAHCGALIWVCIGAAALGDTFYVNGTCGDDAWSGRNPTCGAPNGPKRNILSAIQTSTSGDTIVVADGVYTGPLNKDLTFGGRAITLRSENGPENCIIDCEGDRLDQHRAMLFGDEDEGIVIQGLTIRNGYVDFPSQLPNGGGILCVDSSPTIVDCVFERNVSWSGRGGGMHIDSGDPLLVRCVFRLNEASDGGGLSGIESSLTLVDCTFLANGSSVGGGVYASRSSVSAYGCTFTHNGVFGFDVGSGGAIFTSGSDVALFECEFVDNQAWTFEGGAIRQEFGRLVVEKCVFTGNWSTTTGGAIDSWLSSDVRVLDSIFFNNEAMHARGGALFMSGGVVRNCTIYANFARFDGGGLSGPAMVSNCIIRNNQPNQIASNPIVTFSNVQGGWPGEGNIDVDPRFASDLRLGPRSPCIDAGDPALVPRLGEVDIDGQARVWAGRVDMGADEFGSFGFGDVNCDGDLDALDIEPFLLALFDPGVYQSRYPDCDADLADLNFDGVVDALDIERFIGLLFP